jgi:O-antigen ligase
VPTLVLVALVVALVAPRSTPGGLALLALPIILATAIAGQLDRAIRLAPLELALALFGGYLALNAAWAASRGAAYGKVAIYLLFVIIVSLAATAIPRLDRDVAERVRRAIVAAIAVGAAYLAIEIAFGQPLKRLVTSLLPFLRPSPKHAAVEDGWVKSIGLYVLNRNLAVLVMLIWPTFLIVRTALAPATARLVAGGLLVLTAVAVLRSEHETSMLALVAGCLVFAGTHAAPRIMRGVLLAAWIAATMLIVPVAGVSYSAGLYQAEWLPKTARNRIVLWGVTAGKVREAPLLGIGIDSTKPLDEQAADGAAWPANHPYPLRTGRHSHSIYMQTWYELGAVGAAFLLAIGLLVLRAFGRAPGDAQPYLSACFTATAVISAFSWGMWQPWFMAAYALLAVIMLLALDGDRRGRA